MTRGMAILPRGNQEPLLVRDNAGRPQVSLGWTSPWNVMFLPFSGLTLLVGWQEGHPAGTKLGVGLLVVTIWLHENGAAVVQWCRRTLSVSEYIGQAVFRVRHVIGRRAFASASPTVWNSLPDNLRHSTVGPDQFQWELKTHLFACLLNTSSTVG